MAWCSLVISASHKHKNRRRGPKAKWLFICLKKSVDVTGELGHKPEKNERIL